MVMNASSTLDRRLADNEYLAGDYTISYMAVALYGGLAENAIYGDAGTFLDVQSYKNPQRWTTPSARPAVARSHGQPHPSGDPAGQLRRTP